MHVIYFKACFRHLAYSLSGSFPDDEIPTYFSTSTPISTIAATFFCREVEQYAHIKSLKKISLINVFHEIKN